MFIFLIMYTDMHIDSAELQFYISHHIQTSFTWSPSIASVSELTASLPLMALSVFFVPMRNMLKLSDDQT